MKINDDVIPDVTALPFEYTVPAATYPVDTYVIILEVENSRGLVTKDMVTVTLVDKNAAPPSARSTNRPTALRSNRPMPSS